MPEKKNYLPVVFNRALAALEDPTGLDRPRWADYSRWQKLVNAVLSVANGVRGMAHRATISWGYQDPFFVANYAAFKDLAYRTSYHVIYPGEPVIRQLDNWYSVHPQIETVPRVLDLELHHNQPYSKIADMTWEMVEVIIERDGIPPILYTRYMLANKWLASWSTEMLNAVWWWLAQYRFLGYLEHPGPPTLPDRVKREMVVMQQTSDHKLAPAGEVASKSVDWDRWEIGNDIEMHGWIDETWGGEGIEPPPDGAIIPIDHVVTTANLNMRTQPNANSLDIGTLKQGSDVSLTKIDGGWGKVEGWISRNFTDPVE